MTPDRYTNTEADAGRYEAAHFMPADDRPDPSELDDPVEWHRDPWKNPTPPAPHTHTWLPPIQLCACCGVAREVQDRG